MQLKLRYSDTLVNVIAPKSRQFNHLKNIRNSDIENFLSESTLDPSQQDAFRMSLANPISLIQGPPGTGILFWSGVFLMQKNKEKHMLLGNFVDF